MIKELESLQYVDSQESITGKPILCKLQGPVADCINATRNGRKYTEELWERVFKDPIIKEHIESGGLLLELNHPEERLETDLTKVCACMPELPKKDKNGLLTATIDVLNTPNGRILACLAAYGYKLGISSRGDGELIKDFDGTESVDPSAFHLETWDIVLLPAIKSARLHMLESKQNKKPLFEALSEAIKKSNPDEQEIMLESIKDLKLDIEYNPEKDIDKKSEMTANDSGVTMVKELQEALIKQQTLELDKLKLEEKLSVCYTKEMKYEEELSKQKEIINNLTESVKKHNALLERFTAVNNAFKNKEAELQKEKQKQQIWNRKITDYNQRHNALNESISRKTKELQKVNESLNSLQEDYKRLEKQSLNESKLLEEKIAEAEKILKIKTKEYSSKLNSSNNLVEQYRKTAKLAVDKYIESKALALNLDSNEIKNKLQKNYSFNDIDRLCESLSSYKLKLKQLPFDLQSDNFVIKESQNKRIIGAGIIDDDSIDDSLIRLAENTIK